MKHTIKVTRWIAEEATIELDLTAKQLKALNRHDLEEIMSDMDERWITSTVDKISFEVL